VEPVYHSAWAVDLAVDLVNTGPWRPQGEQLGDVASLRRFLAAHREPEPIEPGERDLAGVHLLRGRLRRVFGAADEHAVVATLNALLAEASTQPRLSGHDGTPVHLHFSRPDASWAEGLAATTAMALALVVADHGAGRLRRCEAAGCEVVFADTSRNHARRYCSETCANRARVAAFRSRHRAARTR
jgi:predicted RNA-binding Zn ribbon-like protein